MLHYFLWYCTYYYYCCCFESIKNYAVALPFAGTICINYNSLGRHGRCQSRWYCWILHTIPRCKRCNHSHIITQMIAYMGRKRKSAFDRNANRQNDSKIWNSATTSLTFVISCKTLLVCLHTSSKKKISPSRLLSRQRKCEAQSISFLHSQ